MKAPSGIGKAIAALAAAQVLGCDPGITIHGRVTSSKGTPVRQAEVRIECPDLCAYTVVRDDSGSFWHTEREGCPVSCRLRVRSSGFRDFTGPLSQHCLKESGGRCSDAVADVRLESSY
jgi:hypothetical protein